MPSKPRKINVTYISEEFRAGWLFGHAIWFPWSVTFDWMPNDK